ncbi:hypothetical protein RHMOL_Rhmol03G0105200 [Rhododendron molle]|uniref:Uncharacterized protein n=1 Tax=Rhododendron molle TaxID=49168 RepID=A0ACC0PCZ1_RHOML|nr:hypothetical protein RHMOL_Rhmol03G0105200 [Rhododendron molle]
MQVRSVSPVDEEDDAEEQTEEEETVEDEAAGASSSLAPSEQNDEALRLFREVYRIPDNVEVSPVRGSHIKFSNEHVTVPLMAITEGGLRFPMHKVIRELLHSFNLTPCQLTVNTYRLIHSVVKLAEVKMFHLEAYHLFGNYMMSRNLKYSRYFLCSQKKKPKLIVDGMYDSEKWASDYVEIRGNFMYPPDEYGQFEVPKRRGCPTSAPWEAESTKRGDNRQRGGGRSRDGAERHHGRSRKEKEEEAGGGEGQSCRKSSSSVGDLAEKTPHPTGSKVPPPPSLASKRPHPPTAHSKDDVAEKKQKTTEAGSAVQPEIEKGKGTSGSATAWHPQFIAPDKCQITNEDSLAADPSIARTLFHSLALPKDVKVPESLKAAIDDHYFHAGRAMQSLMCAQLYISDVDKRMKVQQQLAERYKKQLDNSDFERDKLFEQITTLNEMVQQLQGGTEKARAEGKKEGETERRDEMDREKKKAFDEGYSQGYNKAVDELVDQALDATGVAADDAKRTTIEVPPLIEQEPAQDIHEEQADANVAASVATEHLAEAQASGNEGTSVPIKPTATPDA